MLVVVFGIAEGLVFGHYGYNTVKAGYGLVSCGGKVRAAFVHVGDDVCTVNIVEPADGACLLGFGGAAGTAGAHARRAETAGGGLHELACQEFFGLFVCCQGCLGSLIKLIALGIGPVEVLIAVGKGIEILVGGCSHSIAEGACDEVIIGVDSFEAKSGYVVAEGLGHLAVESHKEAVVAAASSKTVECLVGGVGIVNVQNWAPEVRGIHSVGVLLCVFLTHLGNAGSADLIEVGQICLIVAGGGYHAGEGTAAGGGGSNDALCRAGNICVIHTQVLDGCLGVNQCPGGLAGVDGLAVHLNGGTLAAMTHIDNYHAGLDEPAVVAHAAQGLGAGVFGISGGFAGEIDGSIGCGINFVAIAICYFRGVVDHQIAVLADADDIGGRHEDRYLLILDIISFGGLGVNRLLHIGNIGKLVIAAVVGEHPLICSGGQICGQIKPFGLGRLAGTFPGIFAGQSAFGKPTGQFAGQSAFGKLTGQFAGQSAFGKRSCGGSGKHCRTYRDQHSQNEDNTEQFL